VSRRCRELADELDVDWDLRFKDAKKDRSVGEAFRNTTLCYVDAVASACMTAITSRTAVR
jgi:hypothetical protein